MDYTNKGNMIIGIIVIIVILSCIILLSYILYKIYNTSIDEELIYNINPITNFGNSQLSIPKEIKKHNINFINNCQYPIWIGSSEPNLINNLNEGGWKLNPNNSNSINLPDNTNSVKFWGRTNCNFEDPNVIIKSCKTGNCVPSGSSDAKIKCMGSNGKPPATQIEFIFGLNGKDYYNVSFTNGFNIPIIISPVEGTYIKTALASDPKYKYDCTTAGCSSNFNNMNDCFSELQIKDENGNIIGCKNICKDSKTCFSNKTSELLKTQCPNVNVYPTDQNNTFSCKGGDYNVIFCPTQ